MGDHEKHSTCGAQFELANGELVTPCEREPGHTGEHKGWCLGSPTAWPQGVTSEEQLAKGYEDEGDDAVGMTTDEYGYFKTEIRNLDQRLSRLESSLVNQARHAVIDEISVYLDSQFDRVTEKLVLPSQQAEFLKTVNETQAWLRELRTRAEN